MLATPPFGASSNKALLRANIKPPVELVVADLEVGTWTVGLGTDFYGSTQYTSVHTVKAPIFKA